MTRAGLGQDRQRGLPRQSHDHSMAWAPANALYQFLMILVEE